ncbi:nesprin-3 isoform X3 [Hyperolius riggenbachi]|uniref:nesprin-3 isoform X3 n=1 Tax=Hyperolius riggenbachi TaxID=752182 RepID=UPI0035A32CC6
MTQLPQDEFETCLEKAEAWMKDIQERLKENDNTQGPRSALECRLRETEKICALEPRGKMLLDMALSKAEAMLRESCDDEKHEVHVKLGKIKAMFEETTIYMTHCHSRIEWVWLHWNEYLRARDEFTAWVHHMTLLLEPDMELQLGLKEKLWQHEQSLVLLRDVNNQSKLLERLLEEASSLYNRIGDPSVDEGVQTAMANQYKQVKKKTQERVKKLERIWKDHKAYENDVTRFKAWLSDVIEKLKRCVGSDSQSTEARLGLLQEIGKDVDIGKKQLEDLEEKSAAVIQNTSPLGADKICKELEELRRTLRELKMMNDEEEDNLLKSYNSENAFLQLARQLEANINEFRKAIQRLEESLESGERVKTEEDLIALWKTLNVTKTALAGEEAKAERVKVQLKDLFKFSKDIQPLSDGVIAAMREYQRAKSKAFKLSTDTESELRQIFQNPLREFLYWKPLAESILDSSETEATNGSVTPETLDRIEMLLEESRVIQEKLAALEERRDRVYAVLGDDKTRALLKDVLSAENERESLHCDLSERKDRLQSLAAQSEELDSAFRMLQKKLSALRKKCAKENELQPDIIGKEAQLQRLQVLLEELTKLYSPIKEFSSKVDGSPNHIHQANKLQSDFMTLQRSLENNIRKTKEDIHNHRRFNDSLLDLHRWVMETHQELKSYKDGSKPWEGRQALLAEVSEKEIQHHQVEAQGQLVIDSSSPEGAAFVHMELKQLIKSWEFLRHLCDLLSRTLKEREGQRRSPSNVTMNQSPGFLAEEDPQSQSQPGRTPNPGRHSNGSKQEVGWTGVDGDPRHNGGVTVHRGDPSGAHYDISLTSEDLDDVSVRKKNPMPGGINTKDPERFGYRRSRLPVRDTDNGCDQTPPSSRDGCDQTPPSSRDGCDQTPPSSRDGCDQTPPSSRDGCDQTPPSSRDGCDQTPPSSRDDGSTQGTLSPGQAEDSDAKSPGRQTIHVISRDDGSTQGTLSPGQAEDSDAKSPGRQTIHVISSTEIDGYPSSKSPVTDKNKTSNRTPTGLPGNQNSKVSESFRLNISGKSGFSFDNTAVESAHNGSSSRIISPEHGTGSPDRTAQSDRSPGGRSTTHSTSRISSPEHGTGSPDRTAQSDRSPGGRSTSHNTSRISSPEHGTGSPDRTDRSPGGRSTSHNTSRISSPEHGTGSPDRTAQSDRSPGGRSTSHNTSRISSPEHGTGSPDRTAQSDRSPGGRSTSHNTSRISSLEHGTGSPDRTAQSDRSPGERSTTHSTSKISSPGQATGSPDRTAQSDRSPGERSTTHSTSRIISPEHGSGSPDKTAYSARSPGERSTTHGTSRISSPEHGSGSPDKTAQSDRSPGERSTTHSTSRISNPEHGTGSPDRTAQSDRSPGERITTHNTSSSPEHGTGSPDRTTQSDSSPGERITTHHTSRISSPEHGTGSPDRTAQSDRSPGERSTTHTTSRISNSDRIKTGSPDESSQSVRSPGERSTTHSTSGISSPAHRTGLPGKSTQPAGRSGERDTTQSTSGSSDWQRGGGWQRGGDWQKGGHWQRGEDWQKGGDWQRSEDWQRGEDWQIGGRDLNSATFKRSPNETRLRTGLVAENSPSGGDRNSPSNPGTSRRGRHLISLAESVDVTDSSPARSMTGDDNMKLLLEFERWLKAENAKLSRICASEGCRDGEESRQHRLQKLRARVPQGQKLFESLLKCRSAMGVTEDLRLEDLRYRWMLYKTKLRETGSHTGLKLSQETRGVTKKSGGVCSFLHRVCCAALPLQLLLLLLLLLAFLLPLLYENQNCALANNFARSFNLMLKYDGPPPT